MELLCIHQEGHVIIHCTDKCHISHPHRVPLLTTPCTEQIIVNRYTTKPKRLGIMIGIKCHATKEPNRFQSFHDLIFAFLFKTLFPRRARAFITAGQVRVDNWDSGKDFPHATVSVKRVFKRPGISALHNLEQCMCVNNNQNRWLLRLHKGSRSWRRESVWRIRSTPLMPQNDSVPSL